MHKWKNCILIVPLTDIDYKLEQWSLPFSVRFLANLSRTFLSWYRNFKGFHVSPDRYSIQVCTFSTVSVSLNRLNISIICIRFRKLYDTMNLNLKSWLQCVINEICTLMCLRASSSKTSPQGSEFFTITFRPKSDFRLIPALSFVVSSIKQIKLTQSTIS